MPDGSLNFDTKMDTSSVQKGIELILEELRKISAAVRSVPNIKVSADTSEVNAAKQAIDTIPKETDIRIETESDTSAATHTKEAIDDIPKETDVNVKVESDPSEIVDTKDAIEDVKDKAVKTANEVNKAFKKTSNNASSSVSGSCDDILKTLSGTLGKVKALIAATGIAIGIKEIIGLGKNAVEEAAKVKAVTSQLDQTFGSLKTNAEDAISRIAKQSGILDTRLRGAATSIYAFAKTSGMDSAAALSLMKDALKVTADSAAYYDRSLEDTSETLKSFLKGNYANDAALGLSATEYTRNAAAMELYGKSFQDLTEAQKQLTLLQMVKDANKLSGAEGQAAREADGWENVIGNLKEAWSQLLAVVGQPILDIATIAIQKLTIAIEYLTEKARAAIAAMNRLLGRETKQSDAMASSIDQSVTNQEALTDAVKDTTKAQKKSLAAFDQLNTLSSNTENAAGGTAATSAAQSMPLTLETSTAENDLDKFTKKFKEAFANLKAWWQENFAPIFSKTLKGIEREAGEFMGTLGHIFADIQTLAEPLRAYFNDYFLPFLQTTFSVAGEIIVGLLDTFNMVFRDIWDIVVFPWLQTMITVGLPMITEFATEAVATFGVWFKELKTIFDMLWEDVAKPVLGFIMKMWQDVMLALKKFWDKYGHPIFEKFRVAIQNTSDIFQKAWTTYLKPIFDKLMAKLDEVWDEHMKPLVDELLEFVGEFITAALDIYNGFIAPIVEWMIEKFGPSIVKTFDNIIDMVGAVLNNFIDVTKGIIEALKGVVKFVAGVFTGDWERAWEGVKDIFSGVFNALVNIAEYPINLIIGMLNGLLTGIETAIQAIGDALGDVDFDIPSWVPGIGGKSFHLDLGTLDIPRIPYLAQGTVVPANYGEFLAVLGDNKREAEVVSPVSAIKQAMLEAMAENGGTSPKELVVYTYLYPNSAAYHREIINIVNSDARNRGGV